MANNFNQQNKTQTGTNVQQVRQQNASSAGSSGQFGTEFASQTDVQQVKKQNQQAEANKAKASGNYGQNSQQ